MQNQSQDDSVIGARHFSPVDLARKFVEVYKASGDTPATVDAIRLLRDTLLNGPSVESRAFLENTAYLTLPKVLRSRGFIVPNEEYPQDAIPILKHAREGAYVSVGTERGFISAALNKNFSSLVLVDRDPRVVRFNGINAALLEAAASRNEYAELRVKEDIKSWRYVANRPEVSESGRLLLGDLDNWRWWQANVRVEYRFKHLHNRPWPFVPGPFKGANYLHYEDQFQQIKKIAKNQKITSAALDLGDKTSIDLLCAILKHVPDRISVLDLSNAWQYMSPKALPALLTAIKPHTRPSTILLVTKAKPQGWAYIGFTFNKIYQINGSVLLPKALTKERATGHAMLQRLHGTLDGEKP